MPIRLLRRPTDTASGRLLVAVGAGGPSLFAAKREKTFSSIFPPSPHPFPSALLERSTFEKEGTRDGCTAPLIQNNAKIHVFFARNGMPSGMKGKAFQTGKGSNGLRRKATVPAAQQKRAGESPPVSSLFWRRDQPRFISSMSCESCCVWWARSETACAASFMAWADWEDMSLTSRMDRLISSLAADCSSLAAAMALT